MFVKYLWIILGIYKKKKKFLLILWLIIMIMMWMWLLWNTPDGSSSKVFYSVLERNLVRTAWQDISKTHMLLWAFILQLNTKKTLNYLSVFVCPDFFLVYQENLRLQRSLWYAVCGWFSTSIQRNKKYNAKMKWK